MRKEGGSEGEKRESVRHSTKSSTKENASQEMMRNVQGASSVSAAGIPTCKSPNA
jgi:hypothetical protein